MVRFKKQAKKMIEALGLKSIPIGRKFADNYDEVNQLSKNISICEALKVVKDKKIILTITKETCNCRGGRHFTGLEILPIESLAPALTTKKQSLRINGCRFGFYKKTTSACKKG